MLREEHIQAAGSSGWNDSGKRVEDVLGLKIVA